jgi:hypothetical protein
MKNIPPKSIKGVIKDKVVNTLSKMTKFINYLPPEKNQDRTIYGLRRNKIPL